MRIYITVLIGVILTFILGSCAKQSSPMGGPKDEYPPKLISSNPHNEAINIKPTEIDLVFDEFIKVENPTNKIIITPRINTQEIQFTALKNKLNIKLNQELEDSTTYVFNFQKSVQDITESNPASNLKLVFSTGSEIDSLKFSGKVAYTFPQREIVDVVVGLYSVADTTDLFTAAPYYIAQADSSGGFEITNIKAGEYRAYAWHDDNNSNKAEHRSEAYGFLNDQVTLDSNITDIRFRLFRGDVSELKVNRSSPVASNYDIILNKFPTEIKLSSSETTGKILYRLKDKIIRLYQTDINEDSTAIRLLLKDSVGFSVDTVLYAKFEVSDRSPEKLELTVNSGKSFVKSLQSKLLFNKPVKAINYDSLYIRYDTTGRIPITAKDISLPDSSDLSRMHINITIPDSLNYKTFTVFAADSTFMDVENQWNETKLEANYSKLIEETLSEELSGHVETDELPILVQLLSKSDEVIQETYLTDNNAFKLTNMEAGEYKLRAIIDTNKNKRWDPGNIYEKRQPEAVYYFYDAEKETDQVLLRAGWINNEIIIKPDQPQISVR